MSVEIYGIDDNSEKFRCVGVSGESFFNTVWERAIKDLNLHLIGNMVWLYKKDLPDILVEFEKVKEYMLQKNDKFTASHIDIIIESLENNWKEVPEAERLWMG